MVGVLLTLLLAAKWHLLFYIPSVHSHVPNTVDHIVNVANHLVIYQQGGKRGTSVMSARNRLQFSEFRLRKAYATK